MLNIEKKTFIDNYFDGLVEMVEESYGDWYGCDYLDEIEDSLLDFKIPYTKQAFELMKEMLIKKITEHFGADNVILGNNQCFAYRGNFKDSIHQLTILKEGRD